MSNFFEKIEQDTGNVETELLGPNYSYHDKIATPTQMGMSADPNLKALTNDVSGLIDYIELLISGTGKGSLTGKPLGNQFFLETGAQCKDIKTGDIKTRYLYINNKPTGNIPFLSSGLGKDFPSAKGLIPSMLQDIENINPFSMFKGFMEGTTPDCQEITMETTPSSANNNATQQTEFVTQTDITEFDPCMFTVMDNINPVTKKKCVESFRGMKDRDTVKDDYIYKLYLLLLSGLGIYILFNIAYKNKNLKH
tara:strand:+ start:181 stop:936 length:756 start_codon:yes stop_codon:yes gene_type:complete